MSTAVVTTKLLDACSASEARSVLCPRISTAAPSPMKTCSTMIGGATWTRPKVSADPTTAVAAPSRCSIPAEDHAAKEDLLQRGEQEHSAHLRGHETDQPEPEGVRRTRARHVGPGRAEAQQRPRNDRQEQGRDSHEWHLPPEVQQRTARSNEAEIAPGPSRRIRPAQAARPATAVASGKLRPRSQSAPRVMPATATRTPAATGAATMVRNARTTSSPVTRRSKSRCRGGRGGAAGPGGGGGCVTPRP